MRMRRDNFNLVPSISKASGPDRADNTDAGWLGIKVIAPELELQAV
jgi:hypothetical protein